MQLFLNIKRLVVFDISMNSETSNSTNARSFLFYLRAAEFTDQWEFSAGNVYFSRAEF